MNNDQLDNQIVSFPSKEQAEEHKLFSYLHRDLLPFLLVHGRQQGCSLRCWIMNSDMGRQAFWLAMQLTDLLGDELPDWTIKIFVSETDQYTLALARQGIYTHDQLISFPAAYRQRFFQSVDGCYRVSLAVRSMLIFALHDDSLDSPYPRIDLALAHRFSTCSPSDQQRILARLATSLYPDGLLVIDEQTTNMLSSPYYELLDPRKQVYRCLTTPLLLKQSARRQQYRSYALDASPAFSFQITEASLHASDSRELLPSLTAHNLLSAQETHVLHYLAMGLSNKEIAQNMVITVGTVKRHTGNIYQKLNVHTRMAAVIRAKSLKLLE